MPAGCHRLPSAIATAGLRRGSEDVVVVGGRWRWLALDWQMIFRGGGHREEADNDRHEWGCPGGQQQQAIAAEGVLR